MSALCYIYVIGLLIISILYGFGLVSVWTLWAAEMFGAVLAVIIVLEFRRW